MTLSLSYERCVRTRSVAAECQACVDVCPTQAVSLDGAKRSVDVALDECTACGLCVAACPTDAFTGVFDVAAFVAKGTTLASCGRDGLPCIGALSAEDLVALAAKHSLEVVADGACESGWTGHPRARSNVEQARAFLAALGLPHTITLRDAATMLPPPVKPTAAPTEPVPARRQFLGLFVPRAVPSEAPRLRQPASLDAKLVREGAQTKRRARLLAALPSSVSPRFGSLPAEAIAFTSSKVLNATTCTGCMACVTACPTGALTATRLRDVIRFDGSRCVKCHLCHDVCEPKALTLADELNVTAFVDFSPRPLVKLQMVQCGECGALFKADGGPLCPRCRDHDDEARELWGLKS